MKPGDVFYVTEKFYVGKDYLVPGEVFMLISMTCFDVVLTKTGILRSITSDLILNIYDEFIKDVTR